MTRPPMLMWPVLLLAFEVTMIGAAIRDVLAGLT